MVFGFGKGKNTGNVPSIAQFRELGSAFLHDPEAKEQLRETLIGMNNGRPPANEDEAKKLAGKLVVRAKSMGVKKLPHRIALTMLIEDLFCNDDTNDTHGDNPDDSDGNTEE